MSSMKRFLHWGPLVALGIIKWVTLSAGYCNTMLWPPESGYGALANMIGFMALSCLTTYHFIAAMLDGPGYIPLGWKPETKEEEDCLQYCDACQGYKAPRSHHCRKCNRCVMKMDHHCPWINNCVGHLNQGHFVGFLFFAVCGCFQGAIILGMSLYYGLNRSYYYYYGTGSEPKVILTLTTLITTLFGLGLAIGVVLAVGALLYFQLRSIWRNQSGIEDWILEKAAYRLRESGEGFGNPYHMGGWKNFFQVIRPGCNPKGDGIDWQLREGANKYDMTLEQIYQKRDKRDRTREYKIVRGFSGSWFPLWSMGFKVAFRPPFTDEPRIVLRVGDTVKVTRWKTHWLYGDKSSKLPIKASERVRGWFPRACAADLYREELRLASKDGSGNAKGDKSSSSSVCKHQENGSGEKKKNR